MSRYSKYRNRMMKVSKVLNTLYRFRIPIIATIIVSTAAALTLTGLNGTAQGLDINNTQFIYGEKISAFGKSTFGGADVEYSPKDKNTWTADVPKYVGEYQVRATSKNGFGLKTNSKPVDFVILPKPLNFKVTTSVLTYGDEINYTGSLVYGDHIDNASFDYDENYYSINPFGSKNEFKTKITLDLETFSIKNKDGIDVTSCYEVPTYDKEITIEKRDLLMVINQTEKIYDGTELTTKNNTTVSIHTPLPEGDKVDIEHNTSGVELGTYAVQDEVSIKSGQYDRTNFYNISFSVSEIKIKKRPITITTNVVNRQYNGMRLSSSSSLSENLLSYSLSTPVLDGHEFVYEGFTFEGSFKPVNNALNSLKSYKVVEKDNPDNDVSKYYEFTENYGSVTISHRPLEITYTSISEIFDYQTLEGGYIHDPSQIAATDTLSGSLKDGNLGKTLSSVGTLAYEYDFSIFNNELGLEVNDCYAVNVPTNPGILELKKIPLILTSNSLENVYSGVNYSSSLNTDPTHLLKVDCVGLHEKHTITYDFHYEGSLFINLRNRFTYEIKNEFGEDVSSLYDIKCTYGKIVTHKRDLTVKYASASWVYDGKYHSEGELVESVEGGGTNLATGDSFSYLDEAPTIRDCGVINNYRDFYIMHGSVDVTNYYNIPDPYYLMGELNVTKRRLNISYNLPASKMYDGKPIYINKDEIIIDNLPEGHEINYSLSRNYVSTYQNGGTPINMENVRILNSYGEDVSHNFDIEYNGAIFENFNTINLGTINIYKRPIVLNTYSAEKVYDTHPFTSFDSVPEGKTEIYTISGTNSLAEGDTVQIDNYTSKTLVGNYTNEISYFIQNQSGANVTSSYEITENFGSLLIKESNLKINISGINDLTYNGVDQTFSYGSLTTEGLFDGHIVVPEYLPVKDAGSYKGNEMFKFTVLDSEFNDVTYLYGEPSVICPLGVVKEKELEINTIDFTISLNNSTLPNIYDVISYSELGIGDTITFKYRNEEQAMNDALLGVFPTFYYTILDSAGTPAHENYKITVNKDAKVTLQKEKFEIGLKDNLNMFDFAAYYQNEVLDPNIVFEHYLNHTTLPDRYYLEGLDMQVDRELKEPGIYTLSLDTTNLKIYRQPKIGVKEYVTQYFDIVPLTTAVDVQVKRFELNIFVEDVNYTYNGKYQSVNSNIKDANPDHHVEIINQPYEKNVGTYNYVINSKEDVVVKDTMGNDVTYLYDIIISEEDLGKDFSVTIDKYNIDVALPNLSKSFDGTNFDREIIFQRATVTHDSYFVRPRMDATDKHLLTSTGDYITIATPNLESSYHVHSTPYSAEITITDEDGNDVTENYNINIVPGILTINPIVIYYTSEHQTKTYDGNGFADLQNLVGQKSDSDFVTVSLSAINHLDITNAYAMIYDINFKVGTYKSVPTFVVIYNNEDIVSNGDVIFSSKNMEVEYTITTKYLTIENQGGTTSLTSRKPFAYEYFNVSGLVDGDTLYIGEEKWGSSKKDYSILPNMTEVGRTYGVDYFSTYINLSSIRIIRVVNGEEIDVTDCYDIQLYFNDVTIVEAPI